MLPHVAAVNPREGSTNGGTSLTIVGDGFDGDSIHRVSVTVLSTECTPVAVSLTRIVCVMSRPWGEGVGNVSVSLQKTDGAVLQSICADDCTFNFTAAATPLITSILPAAISSTDASLTISGANFGTTTADVRVAIGDVNLTVTTVTENSVVCVIGDVVAGVQPISLSVLSRGQANSMDITVHQSISLVNPASGSVSGGTAISIDGFGFGENLTSVELDGNACVISAVTPTTIRCITPSTSSAHTAQVQVVSNAVVYATMNFVYSDQDTPQMTTLSATSGYPGDVLTILGAGFGTSVQNVNVSVGNAACVVTSVADNSIDCMLGANAAGTFNVQILVNPQGYASGQLSFTYGIVITAITPNEGNHGAITSCTVLAGIFDTIQIQFCEI